MSQYLEEPSDFMQWGEEMFREQELEHRLKDAEATIEKLELEAEELRETIISNAETIDELQCQLQSETNWAMGCQEELRKAEANEHKLTATIEVLREAIKKCFICHAMNRTEKGINVILEIDSSLSEAVKEKMKK
jgi:chromosome segregation ATPase